MFRMTSSAGVSRKLSTPPSSGQERFHFPPQGFIAGTSLLKKGGTLVRIALPGGVIQFLNPLRPFCGHARLALSVPGPTKLWQVASRASP
jgi:hypothetical protein